MRQVLSTVVVIGMVLAGVDARADVDEAKKLYAKGRTAYNLSDFQTALNLFKRAYIEQNDPNLLFNIAQSERQLGKSEDAERSYRAYLRDSNDVPAGRATEIRALIAAMSLAARLPPPGLEAPRAAVEVHAAPPPAKWYQSAAGWTLTGGGLVVALTGTGLLVHGNDIDGQIGSAMSLAQAQELGDRRDAFRVTGEVLIGVGGAALLAGAIILAVRAGHQTRGAR